MSTTKKVPSTALTVVRAPVPPTVTETEPTATPQATRASRAAAPLPHTPAFQVLMGQWTGRSTKTAVAAALLPLGFRVDLWLELAQMQAAVLRRLQQQQQAWVSGCTGLAQEYQQGKRANTMSRLLEQQGNLFVQFGLLLNKQATDLAGLQKNTDVGDGYRASK